MAEIAEALGHKTLAMVKRYAHLTEEHTRSVIEKMNEKMFGKKNCGLFDVTYGDGEIHSKLLIG